MRNTCKAGIIIIIIIITLQLLMHHVQALQCYCLIMYKADISAFLIVDSF